MNSKATNLEKVVITIAAADRPGVVQALSDTALAHKANWLESSLSHLCGQFVGIVQLAVAADKKAGLLNALSALNEKGITVTHQTGETSHYEGEHETVELYVEANDRPGIVEEITAALSETSANVEQLETWRESASMAGYDLFIAQLVVSLPSGSSTDDLENKLESVSDDLMVTITN